MLKTKIKSVLVKKEQELKWKQIEISSLEDMQKIVGGYLDCISLPYNIDLWINDEGAIVNESTINLILLWDEKPEYHQIIFGPVILTGVDPDTRETVSLNALQRQWIARHLKVAQLNNGQSVLAIDLTDGGAIQ